MVDFGFPFLPPPAAPVAPVVPAPAISVPRPGDAYFPDARYVLEGDPTRQGVGRPAPWNKSLDGHRLPLAVKSVASPSNPLFDLPFGPVDWLAPTVFAPTEIKLVAHALFTGTPGTEFVLERSSRVYCDSGAFGPEHSVPALHTRVGPGGFYLAEYRIQILCPDPKSICDSPFVSIVWNSTPAVTVEHRGVELIEFRNGGIGWEVVAIVF